MHRGLLPSERESLGKDPTMIVAMKPSSRDLHPGRRRETKFRTHAHSSKSESGRQEDLLVASVRSSPVESRVHFNSGQSFQAASYCKAVFHRSCRPSLAVSPAGKLAPNVDCTSNLLQPFPKASVGESTASPAPYRCEPVGAVAPRIKVSRKSPSLRSAEAMRNFSIKGKSPNPPAGPLGKSNVKDGAPMRSCVRELVMNSSPLPPPN